MKFQLFTVISVALATLAEAHPGGHHHLLTRSEMARRAAQSKRCEGQAAKFNAIRKRRAVEKRSLIPRGSNVTINTDGPHYETIQNDTCVLVPEVTAGPYIWPRSQTLRQDMTEGEPGVPLYLDIGVLNVNTCEPLPDVLVDLWHCNSTGSYSSFTGLSPNVPFEELLKQLNVTLSPGNKLDLHTDDTTFLRGMWPTDANGMMEMKTIFPGFYVERTVHIHVQVHTNWVVRANGTVVSDNTISTGQIFFSEELTQQVIALEPYSSHTEINRTTNAVDSIFASENGDFNPVIDIVPLDGDDVTKGMIGYITFGVDA